MSFDIVNVDKFQSNNGEITVYVPKGYVCVNRPTGIGKHTLGLFSLDNNELYVVGDKLWFKTEKAKNRMIYVEFFKGLDDDKYVSDKYVSYDADDSIVQAKVKAFAAEKNSSGSTIEKINGKNFISHEYPCVVVLTSRNKDRAVEISVECSEKYKNSCISEIRKELREVAACVEMKK